MIKEFDNPYYAEVISGARTVAMERGYTLLVVSSEGEYEAERRAVDMLQSIVMLLRQMREGRAEVENQYKRVVPWEGNRAALGAMAQVFDLRPYFEWRGLGFISQSALMVAR